ncbi:MAG: sigma-54-dependent transcriptional regulator [Candidatus Eisenbacteria bacterium]|nr:sigma-54 dependent transcriptional regulator [Candidatus Eisenbacteria bacterium]
MREVLIIDDREDLHSFCRRILAGYTFHLVGSWPQAKSRLGEPGSRSVGAVLLDRDFSHAPLAELIGPPGDCHNEGLHILRRLRREYPEVPVLMITGHRDQETAMEATNERADFLAWEDLQRQPDILRARLDRVFDLRAGTGEETFGRFREIGVVSASPALCATLVSLYQAIPGSGPILLLGETGTGKDTLAFATHALSGDSTRPYVAVNMAALNPNLIESELFGHVRGAFTGARETSQGRIRSAHGGTLFLNEIADLPSELQAKLLTVLDRHEVVPVGDARSYPVRFRLICATSCDLAALVREGRFRRDLYHRIAWHAITIPPLRERREDIPVLIRSFLRDAGQGDENGITGIAREAMDYLTDLPWEGNVRELRAVLEAASAVGRCQITLADVREVLRRSEAVFGPGNGAPPQAPQAIATGASAAVSAAASTAVTESAHRVPESCERAVFEGLTFRQVTARYFDYLTRESGGNLPEVARRAGIAKATVYEWRSRFRPTADD